MRLSVHGLERASTRGISGEEVHATIAAPLLRMRGEDGRNGQPTWLSFAVNGPRLLVIIHSQPRVVGAGRANAAGGVGAGGMEVVFITGFGSHVPYGAELALQAITERGDEEGGGPYLVGRLAQLMAHASAASEIVEKLAAMRSDSPAAAAAIDSRAWAAAADAVLPCLGEGKIIVHAVEGLKAKRGTPAAGKLLAWFRAYASNTRRWLACTDPLLHLPHGAGEEPRAAGRPRRDGHRDASIPGLCALATGSFGLNARSGARLHCLHTPHTQLAAVCALMMLIKGADASPLVVSAAAAEADADIRGVQTALRKTGAGFTPKDAEAQLALPPPAVRGPEQRAERCPDLRAAGTRAILAAATGSAMIRRQPRLLLRLLAVVEPVTATYGGAGAAAAREADASDSPAAGGPGRGGAREMPDAPAAAVVTRVHLPPAEIRDTLSALLDKVIADGSSADLPDIVAAFSHAFARAGDAARIAGGKIYSWKEAVRSFSDHENLHRLLDVFPKA